MAVTSERNQNFEIFQSAAVYFEPHFSGSRLESFYKFFKQNSFRYRDLVAFSKFSESFVAYSANKIKNVAYLVFRIEVQSFMPHNTYCLHSEFFLIGIRRQIVKTDHI